MHGGDLDSIGDVVGFAVEALVGALGVVDDVYAEVAVVPQAPVLAADLLAGGGGVGAGPATARCPPSWWT